MKLSKALLLALAGTAILTSCNKNKKKPTETETVDVDTTTTTTPKEIDSEVAINNFLDKLNEYKYIITGEDFITINVYSNKLIYIHYEDYLDEIYMTVNEDETFKAYLDDEELQEIKFQNEGVAADVLYNTLPNSLVDLVGGNVWDLITNDPSEPLKFTFMQNSDVVSRIAGKYLGFGGTAIGTVRGMTLELDAENPNSARIYVKCLDSSQLSPEEEIKTIYIEFNIEKTDPLPTDSWVENENREYPAPRTEWSSDDETYFTIVFDQGYELDDIMPFPQFATYAFVTDVESIMSTGVLFMRDKLATKKDMEDYIDSLVNDYGFVEAIEKLPDGTERTAYHKQLKDFGDGYYSYSSIYLEYDNGISIINRKYYNHKEYDNLTDTNEIISNKRFAELPQEANIVSVNALDYTYEYVESWANLFTYDLVLEVELQFDSNADIEEYVNSYINTLVESGYSHNTETKICKLENETNQNSLLYGIDYANNVVFMQFKSEVYVALADFNTAIKEAGFSETNLANISAKAKDITPMYTILYNLKHKNVFLLDLTFEGEMTADAFLDNYVGELISQYGFEKASPMNVKVPRKDYAFYNPDKKLIMAFTYQNPSYLSVHFIICNDDFTPLDVE